MKRESYRVLVDEARESLAMALGAIAAHKLRSALTLLGITVGVFSIIVVMTAMRVMQSDIEQQISQLGSHTFMVRKFPAIQFSGPEGFEKYLRRQNITFQQFKRLEQKATLAKGLGATTGLWTGEVEAGGRRSAPDVQLMGETPGSFQARNLSLAEGRLLMDVDVDNARDVCVLGSKLAENLFPNISAIGRRIKLAGINYTVVGVLEPKGGSLGGEQDNFAVVPVTTGMNRFGRWNRTLTIDRKSVV